MRRLTMAELALWRRAALPLLGDADFMLGECAPGEPERDVLCEINVGRVAPFPDAAIAPRVAAAHERLRA